MTTLKHIRPDFTGGLEGTGAHPMSDSDTPEQRVTRKLTTILHADVCGYSRLMGQDEMGTLKQLKEHKVTVQNFLDRHYGRTINWTGDGLLAEFASVVEAVQCAVEIQRELRARNDLLDEDRRMEFRVGINLGDVMVDGNELFGEGVNIAARLQSIAPVGGVLLSGTAFDQVRGKLALDFDFVGRQEVKNISEKIPAYTVVLDPNAKPTSRRISRSGDSYADAGSFDLHPASPARARSPRAAALGGPYAGFWRRSVAFSVDMYIAVAVSFLLSDLTGGSFEPLIALIYAAYLTGFESSEWQASIGKRIMGLKVIDERGERLTISRALGRNFAKVVSAAALMLGFIWIVFSDKKQAWHDSLADTLVIDEDALAVKEGREQKFLY